MAICITDDDCPVYFDGEDWNVDMLCDNNQHVNCEQKRSPLAPKKEMPEVCMKLCRVAGLDLTPEFDALPMIAKTKRLGFRNLTFYVGGRKRANFCVKELKGLSYDDAMAKVPPISILGRSLANYRHVVLKLSPWLDPDSQDDIIARVSEMCMIEEVNYSCYLGSSFIMLDIRQFYVKNGKVTKIVREVLRSRYYMSFIFSVPIGGEDVCANLCRNHVTNDFNGSNSSSNYMPNGGGDYKDYEKHLDADDNRTETDSDDSLSSDPGMWTVWNWVSSTLPVSSNIKVALILDKNSVEDLELKHVQRWCGENVTSIGIAAELFEKRYGSLWLDDRISYFVQKLFAFTECSVFVHGKMQQSSWEKLVKPCFDRLWNMRFDALPNPSLFSLLAQTNRQEINDLKHHQQVMTTETCERLEGDKIKYGLYKDAMKNCLITVILEKMRKCQLAQPLNVAIFGACRGALVVNFIDALILVRRFPDLVNSFPEIVLYVVEKSACGYVQLRYQAHYKWAEIISEEHLNLKIKVVRSDPRDWSLPGVATDSSDSSDSVHSLTLESNGQNENHYLDLAIYELLGNFGDDMLAPESLYECPAIGGNTLCIPRFYASYLTPIQSKFLFAEVYDYLCKKRKKKILKSGIGDFLAEMNDLRFMDNPLIVQPNKFYEIDKPRQCYSFHHPVQNGHSLNRTVSKLVFQAQHDCCLTAFLGNFVADLDYDHTLNTISGKFTAGMSSWMPMVFTLRKPIFLRKDEIFELGFRRISKDNKVWYEWCVKGKSDWQNVDGSEFSMNV